MTEPVRLPVLSRTGNRAQDAENARNFHKKRLQAIEDEYKPLLDAAREIRENAEYTFEELKASLDRYPLYWKPPVSSAYPVLLLALAVAEVPVNRLSFQLFFTDGPMMSLLVAGLVGTILIALAHAIGVMTRRFRHAAELKGGALASSVRILLATALMLAICYGVAVFRQGYLSFITHPDPSFSTLINTNQYGQAALVVLHTGLGIEGWIFLFINLALVCVGLFAAFYRHDPHPNFEELEHDKLNAEDAYAKIDQRRGRAVSAEERRFVAECRRHHWALND